MIEQLIVAGFTGLVIGAFMLGTIGIGQRANSKAIDALHARFDDLVLALIRAGVVDVSMLTRPPRLQPRGNAA